MLTLNDVNKCQQVFPPYSDKSVKNGLFALKASHSKDSKSGITKQIPIISVNQRSSAVKK
jgi:hypothetical protein